jgi:hypothetical protein
VAAIKRARQLDPFSFRINRDVGKLLYFARRYDEALGELRQAGDMQPDSSAVDVWIVKSYLKKGLADEAITMDMRIRETKLKELKLQGSLSGCCHTYHLTEIETAYWAHAVAGGVSRRSRVMSHTRNVPQLSRAFTPAPRDHDARA